MDSAMHRRIRSGLALTALLGLVFGLGSGCGYFKNVRDDFMDIGTFAVGYVPPVICEKARAEGKGLLPPALGIYAQASDFCHLGLLGKSTGDCEWDRRGWGTTHDSRRKFGLGPFHHVWIRQSPMCVNLYKIPHNEMQGWHDHMDRLKDPIFHSPAKTMIFEPDTLHWWYPWCPSPTCHYERLPWLPLGWQDWECISLEIALPEPFILHSGFYLRVGFDPSQIFDFALCVVGLDLYQDAAYFRNGQLRY